MSRPVIFLDRDGVLNERAPEYCYIESWAEFCFLPGAVEAVRRLCQAGCRVVVVTNQQGIALGRVTQAAVDEIHTRMCEAIRERGGRIEAVFVCPHRKGTCGCRKPGIGLFLQAEAALEIDKAHAWMIGDSESDIQAGKRYGIRTALVGSSDCGQDLTADSLLHAVEQIMEVWER